MLVNTYTLQGTVHNTNMVLFTEYLLSKAACFSSENMYIQYKKVIQKLGLYVKNIYI